MVENRFKSPVIDLNIENKNNLLVDKEEIYLRHLKENDFKSLLFSNDFSFNILNEKSLENKRKSKAKRPFVRKWYNGLPWKIIKAKSGNFAFPMYKAKEGEKILKYWKKIKKGKKF